MRKTKGMLAATILSLAIAGCSGQTARKFEVDNEHNSFTIKGTDVPAILRKAYPDFMDNAQKTPNKIQNGVGLRRGSMMKIRTSSYRLPPTLTAM